MRRSQRPCQGEKGLERAIDSTMVEMDCIALGAAAMVLR